MNTSLPSLAASEFASAPPPGGTTEPTITPKAGAEALKIPRHIRRKAYLAEWRAKNKEKWLAYGRAWKKNNPEKHRAGCMRWVTNNPDKARTIWGRYAERYPDRRRAASRKFRLRNPHLAVADGAKRRARARKAAIGGDSRFIAQFYRTARRISRCVGIRFHVDHIRPLSKGGAHHETNLQVIPARINLRKHAKWEGE